MGNQDDIYSLEQTLAFLDTMAPYRPVSLPTPHLCRNPKAAPSDFVIMLKFILLLSLLALLVGEGLAAPSHHGPSRSSILNGLYHRRHNGIMAKSEPGRQPRAFTHGVADTSAHHPNIVRARASSYASHHGMDAVHSGRAHTTANMKLATEPERASDSAATQKVIEDASTRGTGGTQSLELKRRDDTTSSHMRFHDKRGKIRLTGHKHVHKPQPHKRPSRLGAQ